MRGLRDFFDIENFLRGKTLTVTSVSAWNDFETKEPLGTKIEVVISADKTVYSARKDGAQVSNLYEKFYIKVPKKVNIPIGVQVVPVDATGVVYGTYMNMLSVKATDVKIIQPHAASGSASGSAPSHTAQNTGKALR